MDEENTTADDAALLFAGSAGSPQARATAT
jgi:hypothetical protein